MSEESGARIERKGERWHYKIDASQVPAYALFTVYGSPSQAMIERGAADLLDLMDRVIGQDAPFCPVVVDVRRLGSGKMGAATFQWASSRALRRLTRLVIIFDPDLLTRQAYAGFMRVATVVIPHVEVVYSCEEAFEHLGLEAPPACLNQEDPAL